MGNGAQIGFHSSSLITSEQAASAPTGDIGNALMGAYLNRIGLPDRAIVYITQAAPEAMTWLSMTDAKQQGIDVALLPSDRSPPANDPSPSARPPTLPTTAAPTLTAEEFNLADRLSHNFQKRMASGILGLSESIDACYRQTRVAHNENSAKYCIALDFLTVTVGLEMHAEGEDKWSVVHKRALEILLAVNIQEGAEEIISRSALIANGAAEEILRAKSKSTTDAPIPPDSRSYLYYVLVQKPHIPRNMEHPSFQHVRNSSMA
jgi:hypothetical protein